MANEVYRIEIPITAKDEYSVNVDKAERKVTKFEKTVSRMERRLRRRQELVIGAKDRATAIMARIDRTANRLIKGSYNLTVKAIDRATRVLGSIRRGIFSIPSLITVALSVVGVGKLKDATVGAAMSFEQYEVSMTHWLDGNTKKAKELVTWMGQFADKTPFSSPDLFPALTRGIGITRGDVEQAKELLKLSADMSALTPGSSVSDAMEALADAQMGEFERLKAFNQKITQEEFKKIGYAGIIKKLTKEFAGGAEKLSETAAGVLSTLKGYRSSIFRTLGGGILEPMKPRLDAINKWLEENQDTWGRWKDVVYRHGKDASEWIFAHLENTFSFIRTRYLDNDDFMKLDFKGKVEFIWTDIKDIFSSTIQPELEEWWSSTGKPWAVGIGTELLGLIAKGAWEGIQKAFGTLFGMAKNTFNKEGNTIGAIFADAILLILGVKLISGIVKIARGIRTAAKWTKGAYDWGRGFMPGGRGRGGRRGGRGGGSGGSQSRRSEYRQERKRTQRERKKSIHTPTWDTGSQSKKWWKSLWPFGKKGSSGGKASRLGISGMKRVPFLGTGLNLLSLGSANEEELPSSIGGIAGGIAGAKGGAMAGAAIGSVIPGVGTAIGGAAGGIIGGIGGALGGEWLGRHWDTIKEKASEASVWVSTKFNEAKESLSSTLFSGEWWGSKWENVKQTATDTVFSGGWWAEQVGFVFGYLESSLFSGDWWSGHWENVKAWTSEKWESANEIWDNAVSNIDETLFNGEWWAGHWESVKGWASEKVDSFSDVWESAKSSAESTLFSGEWWSGKWGQVKSWAASAWENIKSGFTVGAEQGRRASGGEVYGPPKKYARGGYIDRPHLGLVGEAGPEMIIPLSSGRRNRAMQLYMRTGQMLGVRPYADGGMVGREPVPIGAPQGQSTIIYFGDINTEVNLHANGDKGDFDVEGLAEKIADPVASAIVRKAKEASSNMPRTR